MNETLFTDGIIWHDWLGSFGGGGSDCDDVFDVGRSGL